MVIPRNRLDGKSNNQNADSVESDTFYGKFVVKLAWRLSEAFYGGNMTSHFHTIFILILPKKLHKKYQSPYCVHNFYIVW